MAGAANSRAAPAATPPAIAPVAPFPPEVSTNLISSLHMIQTIFKTHNFGPSSFKSLQKNKEHKNLDLSFRYNFQDSFTKQRKSSSSGKNMINIAQTYSTSNTTDKIYKGTKGKMSAMLNLICIKTRMLRD